MRFDYHIHTSMCGHASGSMEEYVAAAIQKGFTDIGFSDHMPLLYDESPALSMSVDELPLYVDRVLELKSAYRGRMRIHLGIEADYHPATMEQRLKMLNSYPFEYVIGSVHAMDDWIFDDPGTVDRYSDLDIDRFYVDYLETLREMVRTGLFDIVGHMDLVKKFGYRARLDLGPHYRRLLLDIKESGACYEINTAGLRWPVAEMYPERMVVELGAKMGVPVTLGSDAHCPDDVGRDFDVALRLLEECGYQRVAAFSGGTMNLVPLGEVAGSGGR